MIVTGSGPHWAVVPEIILITIIRILLLLLLLIIIIIIIIIIIYEVAIQFIST